MSHRSHPAFSFNAQHPVGTRVIVHVAGTLQLNRTSAPAFPRGTLAFVPIGDGEVAVRLEHVTPIDTPEASRDN